jgi:hypothetical protein
MKQSFSQLQSKIEIFEREFGVVSKNFENESRISGELSRLFGSFSDLKSVLNRDVRVSQI